MTATTAGTGPKLRPEPVVTMRAHRLARRHRWFIVDPGIPWFIEGHIWLIDVDWSLELEFVGVYWSLLEFLENRSVMFELEQCFP